MGFIADLFGNKQPELSKEEDYAKYINSSKWKKKRKRKLKQVGYKCERCGYTRYSRRLEVHHLHYDSFKNERMSDLEVLCSDCHKKADREREDDKTREIEMSRYMSGLRGYAAKYHNVNKEDVTEWHMDCAEDAFREFIGIDSRW